MVIKERINISDDKVTRGIGQVVRIINKINNSDDHDVTFDLFETNESGVIHEVFTPFAAFTVYSELQFTDYVESEALLFSVHYLLKRSTSNTSGASVSVLVQWSKNRISRIIIILDIIGIFSSKDFFKRI